MISKKVSSKMHKLEISSSLLPRPYFTKSFESMFDKHLCDHFPVTMCTSIFNFLKPT